MYIMLSDNILYTCAIYGNLWTNHTRI